MSLYEHVFIARQDISTTQVEDLTSNFAAIISEHGGTVAKTETWGLRTLAYRIKKNRKGHYVLFNLDAPAAAIRELERNQRLSEDVLRFMTIRVDELEEGPSAMMSARSDRDDRPRERRPFSQDKPPTPPTEAAQAPSKDEPKEQAPSKDASKEQVSSEDAPEEKGEGKE
ncbi:MAG: 30S ribosomal protein S6 [Rhodospirillaceae bacterium]|nr:MAG: 30S ribosomal protein S6 [Rhodospirillaceae bacterium]